MPNVLPLLQSHYFESGAPSGSSHWTLTLNSYWLSCNCVLKQKPPKGAQDETRHWFYQNSWVFRGRALIHGQLQEKWRSDILSRLAESAPSSTLRDRDTVAGTAGPPDTTRDIPAPAHDVLAHVPFVFSPSEVFFPARRILRTLIIWGSCAFVGTLASETQDARGSYWLVTQPPSSAFTLPVRTGSRTANP